MKREEPREAAGYREPAPVAKRKPLPRPARAPYVLVALVALALVPMGPGLFELAAPTPTSTVD